MSNLSKLSFRKTTVAVLTALLLIAIAAPLSSLAAAAGAPTATIEPKSGPNGTFVKVSGTGFGVNEAAGAITVSIDGYANNTYADKTTYVKSASQLSTDANGVLSGYFVIQNLSVGAHTVIISDATTSVVAGTFTITAPTVTLSPSSGAAGSSVIVTGSGFPTRSTAQSSAFTTSITNATFSGNPIEVASGKSTGTPTTLSSNVLSATGTYTGTVSLGAVTANSSFTLTDNWGNVATTSLSLSPATLTLSPSSGPVGTVVTATVSGFGPTATITSVKVGNNAYASAATYTPATVTEQGTAAFIFTTPAGDATSQAGVAGAQTVTVTDSFGNVATATFTVTPKVTLTLGAGNENSGTTFAPAGTPAKLFISATGLKANAVVSITAAANIPIAWTNSTATWDVTTGSYSTTTGRISTDANGALVIATDQANTPAAAGSYSITVSDGTNSISTIITLTTTGNIIGASALSGAKGSNVTVTYFGTVAPDAITFDGVNVTTPTGAVQAWPKVSTNQVSFNVPTSASSGLHTIGATGFNSVSFTVLPTTISVLNPSSASVGTVVTVVGSGFVSPAAVLAIQGGPVAATWSDLVGDNLIATFDVPNYIPGAYTLSLSDGVNSASTTFNVAAAQIEITPTTSELGSTTSPVTIAITGSGFKANEAITVYFDSTVITATTPVGLTCINTNGGMLINSGFVIPTEATAGAHTITVIGANGASATATFTVQPKLDALAAVRPGAQVAITGKGFAANSLQTLTVNGTATTWLNVGTTPATSLPTGTQVVTDSNGNLMRSTTVGFVVASTTAAGTLNIVVTDASGNTASTNLTVLASPAITLGSAKIVAGNIVNGVSITGSGFTPGTRSISANLYDGSTLVATVTLSNGLVTVDKFGTLAGLTFKLPASVPQGTYTLRLAATSPSETADATIEVLGAPSIDAPTTAASGANVTITVTGLSKITDAKFSNNYLVNSNVIQTVGGVNQFGGITVPVTGANAFSKTTWFIVPTGLFAGTYLLTLEDSNTGLSVQKAITVGPAIAVTPTTGSKGTLITVSGTGFAASSAITAKVNGAAVVLSTTTTNAAGAIQAATNFTIPVTASATNTLTITDAAGNSASATFTVATPVIQVSPSTAAAGSTVQVIGSAFTPSSPIVVQVNGQVVTTVPASLAANAGGDFITYITVPAGLSGNVTVTATDNSNNVGTATLTVGGSSGTGVPNQTTMTSTAQTTTPSGTATTTFTAGSTVKASFMLQSTSGSRDVVVAVTWQQGEKVYSMASFQTTMTTTASAVSFSNLIPAGVTGTWTATLQVFAADGVTPLGVTTLTFTVS
jgi:hypothetical protein